MSKHLPPGDQPGVQQAALVAAEEERHGGPGQGEAPGEGGAQQRLHHGALALQHREVTGGEDGHVSALLRALAQLHPPRIIIKRTSVQQRR